MHLAFWAAARASVDNDEDMFPWAKYSIRQWDC